MGSDDGVQHSELLSFWTLSIVQYSKKLKSTTFRKLDLFPSSGHRGKTPNQLGPLERANLNHLTNLRKLGMYIMAPEPISTAYFLNSSRQMGSIKVGLT
jgi:hypothetical protein